MVNLVSFTDCFLAEMPAGISYLLPFCLFPGTKEKVLIEILTSRSGAQRQLICAAYQEATGRVR